MAYDPLEAEERSVVLGAWSFLRRRVGSAISQAITKLATQLDHGFSAVSKVDISKAIARSRLVGTARKAVENLTVGLTKSALDMSLESEVLAFRHLTRWMGVASRLRGGDLKGWPSLAEAARLAGSPHERGTLLRQYARSFAQYGEPIVSNIERTVSLGLSRGLSVPQIAGQVLSSNGVVFGYAHWRALRITRTEVMRQYNLSGFEAMRMAAQKRPTILKRLVEMVTDEGEPMDDRVGEDSLRLHGQVRPIEGYFEDARTNQYFQVPPGRPNDRGLIMPWDATWGIPPLCDAEGILHIEQIVSSYNPY